MGSVLRRTECALTALSVTADSAQLALGSDSDGSRDTSTLLRVDLKVVFYASLVVLLEKQVELAADQQLSLLGGFRFSSMAGVGLKVVEQFLMSSHHSPLHTAIPRLPNPQPLKINSPGDVCHRRFTGTLAVRG